MIFSLKIEWVYPYQSIYKTLHSSNNHWIQSEYKSENKKYISTCLLC